MAKSHISAPHPAPHKHTMSGAQLSPSPVPPCLACAPHTGPPPSPWAVFAIYRVFCIKLILLFAFFHLLLMASTCPRAGVSTSCTHATPGSASAGQCPPCCPQDCPLPCVSQQPAASGCAPQELTLQPAWRHRALSPSHPGRTLAGSGWLLGLHLL